MDQAEVKPKYRKGDAVWVNFKAKLLKSPPFKVEFVAELGGGLYRVVSPDGGRPFTVHESELEPA